MISPFMSITSKGGATLRGSHFFHFSILLGFFIVYKKKLMFVILFYSLHITQTLWVQFFFFKCEQSIKCELFNYLGGRYGKIFVLFFVLRESGGTKGGNVLKKCALSNYLCGGGGKGGVSFIFSFFVIFTTCKFLFIFVYF